MNRWLNIQFKEFWKISWHKETKPRITNCSTWKIVDTSFSLYSSSFKISKATVKYSLILTSFLCLEVLNVCGKFYYSPGISTTPQSRGMNFTCLLQLHIRKCVTWFNSWSSSWSYTAPTYIVSLKILPTQKAMGAIAKIIKQTWGLYLALILCFFYGFLKFCPVWRHELTLFSSRSQVVLMAFISNSLYLCE